MAKLGRRQQGENLAIGGKRWIFDISKLNISGDRTVELESNPIELLRSWNLTLSI
jgi:hypothetical protein